MQYILFSQDEKRRAFWLPDREGYAQWERDKVSIMISSNLSRTCAGRISAQNQKYKINFYKKKNKAAALHSLMAFMHSDIIFMT